MDTLKLNVTTQFKLPMGILGMSLWNRQLYAACMDGVYQANLDDKTHRRIDQHDSYVSSVVVIDEGKRLLTAGYDGVVAWFDLQNDKRLRRLKLHDFWSWDMQVSPDTRWLASVTGQYLAGDYKYTPAPETEPSVKIVSVESGEVIHSLSHVPSVQSVAFSADSQFVAAGNLMGDVRVWDCQSGELISHWNTPDFTSWGIIKSHCYLGGIFALAFTPDGKDLLLAGMGPMTDPMAGNGRQLWQRWAWNQAKPEMVDQTHKDQAGEGLMETLAICPQRNLFAMGGRLRGGNWNVALFDLKTGDRVAQLKTGYRVTQVQFSDDASELVVVGTQGQPKPNEKRQFPDFGRIEVYQIG